MKKCSIIFLFLALMISALIADYYYDYDGKPLNLRPNGDEIAVFYEKNANIQNLQKELGSEIQLELPEERLLIISNSKITKYEKDNYCKQITKHKNIRFATPVFGYDKNRIIPTGKLFVKNDGWFPKPDLSNFGNITNSEQFEQLDNLFCIEYDSFEESNIFEFAELISKQNNIKYCTPDFLRIGNYLHADANDTYYIDQWYLNNAQQIGGIAGADIDIENAWDITTGYNPVKVAVLDTGIDIDHVDLDNNISGGYDAVDNDNDPTPNSWNPHGTACAGIIGAESNNLQGITAIGWTTDIIPIRVTYSTIGNPDDYIFNDFRILSGLMYAEMEGADVISCSWGFPDGQSDVIDDAIDYVTTNGRDGKGIPVVFSAGNYHFDDDPPIYSVRYPATLDNVIAVGATNQFDERKTTISSEGNTIWGSCWGPELDLMAPGFSIYTTDISGNNGYGNGDYYSDFEGTSAAAPMVAGAIALKLSTNDDYTLSEIKQLLYNSCDFIEGQTSFDEMRGNGRLNVRKLIYPQNFIVIQGGTISENTVWHSDNVYYIQGSLTISSGATLTVEPGTIIKFKSEKELSNYGTYNRRCLTVNGTLIADGTESFPIVFTSSDDDTYGGDTNGNGNATVPNRYDWGNIKFNSDGSTLDNCIIRYNGLRQYYRSGTYGTHYYDPYSVWLNNISAMTISNCTFEYNLDSSLDGGSKIIYANYNLETAGELTVGNCSFNSCYYGIYVEANNKNYTVSISDSEMESISNYAVYLRNSTGQMTINNSDIDSCNSGIYCYNSQISTTNCTVTNSTNYGMNYSNILIGSTIENNVINQADYGCYITHCSPTFETNTIENTTYPITQDGNGFIIPTGNILTNNSYNGICVSGTISENVIWSNYQDFVLIPISDIIISSGATLTVEPGTIIKFKSEKELSNYGTYNRRCLTVNGTLIADGTESFPIVFTSSDDDTYGGDTNGNGNATVPNRYDWGNIKFNSDGSTLDNCTIRYNGLRQYYRSGTYGTHYYDPYSVWLNNISAMTISNCTFEYNLDSSLDGGSKIIYANYNLETAGELTVGNCSFNSCYYGIYVEANNKNYTVSISDSEMESISNYAVYLRNSTGQMTINNSDIDSCNSGIYCYNSQISTTNCTVTNSTNYGMNYSNILIGSTIENNVINQADYGCYITHCSPTFETNTIENTTYPITQDGNGFIIPTGNILTNNSYNGICVSGTISENVIWSNYQDFVLIPISDIIISSGATLTVEPGTIIKFKSEKELSNYGTYNRRCLTVNGTLIADGTESFPIVFTSSDDDTYGGDTNGNGNATVPNRYDWGNIKFNSDGSTLDNCTIRYNGLRQYYRSSTYGTHYYDPYSVWLNNISAMTISNCTFEYNLDSSLDGGSKIIYANVSGIDSATININNCRITSGYYGIYIGGNSSGTICNIYNNYFNGVSNSALFVNNIYEDSEIENNIFVENNIGIRLNSSQFLLENNNFIVNSNYGIYNNTTTPFIATNNWWNDLNGPTHSSNPGENGDSVSDNIVFDPWLIGASSINNGILTGNVTNDSGEPIVNAEIFFDNYSAQTDAYGDYFILAIEYGNYNINAYKQNFNYVSSNEISFSSSGFYAIVDFELIPTETQTGQTSLFEGTTSSFDFDSEINLFPDGSNLDFFFWNNDNIDIVMNGNIASLTPDENWYGIETVNFKVTNIETAEVKYFLLTTQVDPVNDMPILAFPTNLELFEGEILTFQLSSYIYDADTSINDIDVNWSGNNDMEISRIGNTLRITPPNAYWTGQNFVTWFVNDVPTDPTREQEDESNIIVGEAVQGDTPSVPNNVNLTHNGNDMIISWDQVTTSVNGNPIAVDYYIVYFSETNFPDSFYYLGYTAETELTHEGVCRISDQMFYRVEAFVGDFRSVSRYIQRRRDSMSAKQVKSLRK